MRIYGSMNNNNFIIKSAFKTINFNNKLLHPYFLTGLIDGEGSFIIRMNNTTERRSGWSIQPIFQLRVHNKDAEILELIKDFFFAGKIYNLGSSSILAYKITSIKDMATMIDHLDKYPLITNKLADYILFKEVVGMMILKEHLTSEGLEKIVAIKAAMNRGLPEELEAAFPHILPKLRPKIIDQTIKDPNWISGFTSGEGCFLVNLICGSAYKTGYQVLLRFQLTQHLEMRL